MPTTTHKDVVLAAFLNTDAIAGELRGGLFVLLLVLAGYMIFKVMKGDMRETMQRLIIVAVAVLTVGLAGALLIHPEKSTGVTETVVNVDPNK